MGPKEQEVHKILIFKNKHQLTKSCPQYHKSQKTLFGMVNWERDQNFSVRHSIFYQTPIQTFVKFEFQFYDHT